MSGVSCVRMCTNAWWEGGVGGGRILPKNPNVLSPSLHGPVLFVCPRLRVKEVSGVHHIRPRADANKIRVS